MIPVITSTNTDKLNIVLAGVDSGAKILVRPVEEFAVLAAAVDKKQDKNANICIVLSSIEFLVRRIFVDPLRFELRV